MKKAERNKLKKLLHQLVVVRDKECLRCGATKTLQASHIYPRGTYPNMQWMPINVKALCFRCHKMFWHAHPMEAKEWAYKVLGKERLTKLRDLAFIVDPTKPHTDYELNEIILTKAINDAKIKKINPKTKRNVFVNG